MVLLVLIRTFGNEVLDSSIILAEMDLKGD
jgi:hypothetical protein